MIRAFACGGSLYDSLTEAGLRTRRCVKMGEKLERLSSFMLIACAGHGMRLLIDIVEMSRSPQ